MFEIMLRSPFHIHPITSPSPLENDNITTNSYTHSAIFLVEQYLGNQVGPVSTPAYTPVTPTCTAPHSPLQGGVSPVPYFAHPHLWFTTAGILLKSMKL